MQVRRACEPLGIPVRGQIISWGQSYASFAEAKQAWQDQCNCGAVVNNNYITRCSLCGGGQRCQLDGNAMTTCRWCGGDAEARCTNCRRAVHYLGQCSRWNRGASLMYALEPHQEHLLCPDCLWAWAQVLSAAARVPNNAPLAQELQEHLTGLAGACQAGAGSATAQPANSPLSLRRVRRWLLRRLRHGAWVRVASLLAEAQSVLCPDASSEVAEDKLRRVIAALVREGRINRDGAGGNSAIARGGGQPRVSHRRLRRRRPNPAAGRDESSASRRRAG